MQPLLRPAVVLLGLFTVITGVAYPFAVTGAAQVLFPVQANASLIYSDGQLAGSALIGQSFQADRYFWGRPSATSPFPYNASASSGSNLGPSNPAQADVVRRRAAALRAADPERAQVPIPVDLVTASASGLDPDISPAAAFYQIHRVARVRGISEAFLRQLVEAKVERRALRLFGEPRVNVLRLNLALDALCRSGT